MLSERKLGSNRTRMSGLGRPKTTNDDGMHRSTASLACPIKSWWLKLVGLIRDGEVGGSEILISNTYSLHCYHQNDSALKRAAV